MYNKKEIISSLPFAEKFDRKKTVFLATIAEITECNKGHVISKQFEHSHSLYFLLDGHVNFSISVEDSFNRDRHYLNKKCLSLLNKVIICLHKCI